MFGGLSGCAGRRLMTAGPAKGTIAARRQVKRERLRSGLRLLHNRARFPRRHPSGASDLDRPLHQRSNPAAAASSSSGGSCLVRYCRMLVSISLSALGN